MQSSLVKITTTTTPKTRPPSSKLIFGHTFTDHMLTIPWSSATGWGTPEIKPCMSALSPPHEILRMR
jgi:branched-chain amino acid aminotransferase